MRSSRPSRITALWLLVLLGLLSTGLPSHHHWDSGPAETGVRVLSADHHSHGTQLVEPDERAPSGGPHLSVAIASRIELPAPAVAAARPPLVPALRPTSRAPPPGAPRAPPLPA